MTCLLFDSTFWGPDYSASSAEPLFHPRKVFHGRVAEAAAALLNPAPIRVRLAYKTRGQDIATHCDTLFSMLKSYNQSVLVVKAEPGV